MRLSGRFFLAFLVLTALIGSALPINRSKAQQTITLTVAVPTFQADTLTDKLLAEFETAHPGVKVKVIAQDTNIPDPALSLDNHFTELGKYAASADLLYVNANNLSVEGTRAGYFLDLAPLVSEDTTLKPDDFYPAVWQSLQWDKSIWALPTSANVIVMTYKPSAFDKAGIAYPTEKWTRDDMINAVNKLAQKDATGTVTVHGIDVYSNYSTAVLFRDLAGENLYDSTQVPNAPQLDTPSVESLMDAWYKLDSDGLVGHDLNVAPLSLSPATAILFQNAISQDEKRIPLLLPGNKGGLDVSGFAISKGTLYPDQAYALASFLTTRPEIAGRFASVPARRSLVGSAGSSGGFQLNITPEVQQLIDNGVANGIPVAEVRYANYLALAVNNMKLQQITAQNAIQAVETMALSNLQAAADKKDKLAIVVATPAPASVKTGKPTLKFGMVAFARPLPNKDKWDKLIADFVDADPQIGDVNIDLPTGFATTAEALADKYDCFYLPFNTIPDVQNFGQLLNLDPYIGADSSFDKADIVGTSMAQVTRDNKVWALPIDIQPDILKYDSEKFDKAGVPPPAAGWTIDGFNDAVKALKVSPQDKAPFASTEFGGTHLLILIAAYGGLPMDFRTNPPTLNYTDPANVDAIRQVLDLAKSGYLKYDGYGTLNFFGGGGKSTDVAILTTALNAFSFRGDRGPTTAANGVPDTYKPTTYPKGKQYNAVSYSIGTAYISSKSQNADGCYRWISTIAKNPRLFNAMPARRSMLNDPAQAAAQGADTIALYKQIDALLKDSNTISVPALTGARNSFFSQLWLYQAFDSYVQKNGDLEGGLKDAEAKGKALTECVAKLAPYDPTSADSMKSYARSYGTCVTKIDPSFAPLFALIR